MWSKKWIRIIYYIYLTKDSQRRQESLCVGPRRKNHECGVYNDTTEIDNIKINISKM